MDFGLRRNDGCVGAAHERATISIHCRPRGDPSATTIAQLKTAKKKAELQEFGFSNRRSRRGGEIATAPLASGKPRPVERYYFAAAFLAELTFFEIVSLVFSKEPFASWPSASPVFSVTPKTSWPVAYIFSAFSFAS